MSTRESILEAVLNSQPDTSPLPDLSMFKGENINCVERYIEVFNNIGGTAYLVDSLDSIKTIIQKNFDSTKRFVTNLPELTGVAELLSTTSDPHTFEDVELAIIKAQFCVAENGAVWLTEQMMGQRIIPYICQHLAVVVDASSVVPTLHEAYAIIGVGDYAFGGFIGGPSKTADIEQALVLGAHGPLSMTVFLIN